MTALFDGKLERHEGPEPRVLTEDVQRILQAVIRPESEDDGISAAVIALKARVSPRTVYRVLAPKDSKLTISLDLADRLCLAAGEHLASCRLVWPDGRITAYAD